jgi:hypothetical protein
MLKFIGLGSITTAIAPAVLLQACKEAAAVSADGYTYTALNASQAAVVKAIQDTIIPRTDTPSASDVGSVEFLDTYMTHAYAPEDKEGMLHRLNLFASKLKDEHSVKAAGATEEQMGAMMEQYFVNYKAPKQATDVQMEIEGNTIDSEGADTDVAYEYKDDAYEINSLLAGIRWITLESYFQSEEVGTEVLNYLPVPGPYIGQMPIADLPNGRNWSL